MTVWMRFCAAYSTTSPSTRATARCRAAASGYGLVPDQGMVAYADDAVVKDLRKDESEKLRAWRKAQTQAFTDSDVARLVAISDRIDGLWQAWAEERAERQHELPLGLYGSESLIWAR